MDSGLAVESHAAMSLTNLHVHEHTHVCVCVCVCVCRAVVDCRPRPVPSRLCLHTDICLGVCTHVCMHSGGGRQAKARAKPPGNLGPVSFRYFPLPKDMCVGRVGIGGRPRARLLIVTGGNGRTHTSGRPRATDICKADVEPTSYRNRRQRTRSRQLMPRARVSDLQHA